MDDSYLLAEGYLLVNATRNAVVDIGGGLQHAKCTSVIDSSKILVLAGGHIQNLDIRKM